MNAQSNSLTIHVRGILFDMDGVLISSTASDEKSWLRWAHFHGMEKSFSLKAIHGIRNVDTLRAIRPDLDASVELERLDDFDEEEQDGIAVLPGVRRFIAALPPESWTIVSSASERIMRGRLECAGIHAAHRIVTANDVIHGKPHPEPYETGARILGLAPSECLVIEDAPSGIKSGKAAGCKVLAVLSSHPAADLDEADSIVPSLDFVTAGPAPDGAILIHLAT